MPEAVRDLDRDSRLWTVCWSPFSRFLIERTSITAFAACFACGRPETCEKAVLDLDRDPDFGQFAMALLDFLFRENFELSPPFTSKISHYQGRLTISTFSFLRWAMLSGQQ